MQQHTHNRTMKFDDDNNREYIKPDLFLHSIDKKLKVDLSTNRKLIYPQIGGDLISHRNLVWDEAKTRLGQGGYLLKINTKSNDSKK